MTDKNEWRTPPDILALARAVLGEIDCDPASSPEANVAVGAARIYTKDDSGLDRSKPWGARVWMNPPFSGGLIAPFCTEVADRYRLGEVQEALVLVNCAPETRWSRTLAEVASAICQPKYRLAFLREDGTPAKGNRFAQTIFYLGPNRERFSDVFLDLGWVLWPRA